MSQIPQPHILSYAGRGIHSQCLPDGGVVITIPTRPNHWPLLGFVGAILYFAHNIIGLIVALIATLIVVTLSLFRYRNRQIHITVRLTAEAFSLHTPDQPQGASSLLNLSIPRRSIVELRPNRYDKGLFLRVANDECRNILTHLPRGWIEEIHLALQSAQERLSKIDAQLAATAATASPLPATENQKTIPFSHIQSILP